MIIKGKSRAGPGALATHLGNAETNERVELLETRGTIASDLRGALVEMDAYAAGTNCQRSMYHAAISPEPPNRLTPEQRIEAVDALEAKLGLQGHARAVVLHEKLGREHLHVVWSRIDIEKMRSVSDSHSYRKHEEVARDLERRFGHARVQGAHAERDGVRRPDRTPSRAELRQEERTGIKGKDVRAEVSQAFRNSDGPAAFKAALENRGYQLAKGDRRDLVIVDRAGGIHSLARRLEGVKVSNLRTFMAPLDLSRLPNARDLKSNGRTTDGEHGGIDERGKAGKSYSRGDDYVSQSRAALADHKKRQGQLDRSERRDGVWDRIEEGERRRREASERETGSPENTGASGDREVTDAAQARLDRLNEVKAGIANARGDPDRQREAPGRGPTRSR